MATGITQDMRPLHAASPIHGLEAFTAYAGFHSRILQDEELAGATGEHVNVACSVPGFELEAACGSNGWRVILIEDAPAVRHALQLYLKLEACHVFAVECSSELQRGLRKMLIAPDVIICDVRFAFRRSSYDIIASIRAQFGSVIPAIILVDDVSQAPGAIAADLHVSFFEKPVDGARLVAAMNRLICGYQEGASSR